MRMKKTASIILTLFMIISLALPCLAAAPAKFSLNIVSESDTELVISLDYDGGSSFQNFDFDLKYNDKKLKPTAARDGNGSVAFQLYTKNNGGNSLSIVNKDINPIKGGFAVTVPFKVVQGKDLFIFSFQKLSKQAVEKNDFSIKFTICQLNNADVQTTVSIPWANGSANTAKPTQPSSTAPSDKSEIATASSQPATEMSEVNTEVNGNGAEVSDSLEEAESVESKANENSVNNSSAKKIVIVVAVALCMMILITGVVFLISFLKKKKKDEE